MVVVLLLLLFLNIIIIPRSSSSLWRRRLYVLSSSSTSPPLPRYQRPSSSKSGYPPIMHCHNQTKPSYNEGPSAIQSRTRQTASRSTPLLNLVVKADALPCKSWAFPRAPFTLVMRRARPSNSSPACRAAHKTAVNPSSIGNKRFPTPQSFSHSATVSPLHNPAHLLFSAQVSQRVSDACSSDLQTSETLGRVPLGRVVGVGKEV